MNEGQKKSLKEKLASRFIQTVRRCLDDGQARQNAEKAASKYPGLTRDALADVLIKSAAKRSAWSGATSGAAITGCEALVAAPAPEPSHKFAAVSGIAASITGDLAFATTVQMRLLQEIGHIYGCPFDEDDEDDVWLVFQAAQGLKGVEKAGTYARFIFTETAKKQFRAALRTGVRRTVQNQVIKVAGRRVGKLMAEKYVLRLIPLANIGIGFTFNRWFANRVGRWGKVRARIRSGMFRTVEKLQLRDPEAAALLLPIIFHVGTSADCLTDNTLTLYSQTAKRLKLSDREVAAMSDLNEENGLDELLAKLAERIKKQDIRELLFEAAIITASSSRLEFVDEHHQCLIRLSSTLKVEYSKDQLTKRIKSLRD